MIVRLSALITGFTLSLSPAFAETTPKCFSSPEIPKGKEESVVASITAGVSDDEMITRMVYAESLASECFGAGETDAALRRDVSEGIAWTILNRVRDSKKSGRAVVTARLQYRSTLGTCDVAKRKEFLCPLTDAATAAEKALWSDAVNSVETARASRENPIPGIHNYFFPKAFDRSKNCASYRGKYPDWATPSKEVFLASEKTSRLKGCLRFYRTAGKPRTAPTLNDTVYDRSGPKKIPGEANPPGPSPSEVSRGADAV